jgi:hypothetical protein
VRLAGTLHVSLPSDIIQLFGAGSVPAIIAGSVLGLFELGERFASQRAKDALSKWLLTFDVQKAKALPDGTQELFQSIFGEQHFSWTCFIRSTTFSIGAMIFLSLLVLLINPQLILVDLGPSWWLQYGLWSALSLWLPWSIIIDYISLFKTRVILHVIARLRRLLSLLTPAILAIDFLLYRLLFSITYAFLLFVSVSISLSIELGLPFNKIISLFIHNFEHRASQLPYLPSITDGTNALQFIFFWSGLAPSLWMWLYVLALFVTRGVLRSEKLVNSLRWFLDVEKNPFRSIGAVAAALAFIASVAIILVSAEVSRISAAS